MPLEWRQIAILHDRDIHKMLHDGGHAAWSCDLYKQRFIRRINPRCKCAPADGKNAVPGTVSALRREITTCCTSQINTVWYDLCLPQIPDANILPAQETAPAMLVALNSGRVDLVVTDMPTAMAACVAYPNFKLLDFSETEGGFEVSEEEINIGISLQKGNTELLDAINGVLAEMTVEDFTAMMEEAISVQPLNN